MYGAYVGVLSEVFVTLGGPQCPSQTSSDIQVSVTSCGGGPLPLNVYVVNECEYVVYFMPLSVGTHTLSVMYKGRQVGWGREEERKGEGRD